MERTITEKVIEVTNKLKLWKTPGTAGLGPEYYKTFKKKSYSKIKRFVEWYIKWRKNSPVLERFINSFNFNTG